MQFRLIVRSRPTANLMTVIEDDVDKLNSEEVLETIREALEQDDIVSITKLTEGR